MVEQRLFSDVKYLTVYRAAATLRKYTRKNKSPNEINAYGLNKRYTAEIKHAKKKYEFQKQSFLFHHTEDIYFWVA